VANLLQHLIWQIVKRHKISNFLVVFNNDGVDNAFNRHQLVHKFFLVELECYLKTLLELLV
jgi:hypothetical protein